MRSLPLCAPFLLTACGEPETAPASFTGIDNRTDAKMVVEEPGKEPTQAVSITCEGRATAGIAAVVDSDGRLVLTAEAGVDTRDCTVEVATSDVRELTVRGGGDLEVRATLTALELLDARGNGQIELGAVYTSRATFLVGGTADVTIRELVADDVTFDLSGDSSVEVAGSADHATLRVSGNATFSGADFVVIDLDAEVTGSGSTEITVLGSVTLEGDGSIEIF